MAWWVLPSFLGTPSTPYPRRPKGTKMQISFKKVKPAAKGSKAKAPVKKKAVAKRKAPAKKAAPTRRAPARKASAKKPAAGKKIQVNVGAKKRPQRKKK